MDIQWSNMPALHMLVHNGCAPTPNKVHLTNTAQVFAAFRVKWYHDEHDGTAPTTAVKLCCVYLHFLTERQSNGSLVSCFCRHLQRNND